MKIVIQRVLEAEVTVEGKTVGEIGKGALVLIGIHQEDEEKQIVPLLEKLIHLRIFADEEKKMNLSLLDTQGDLLIVSQFTLYADTKSGRRPSFFASAAPEKAEKLYNRFVEEARKRIGDVQTGIFGAAMRVKLVNDGPVTLILEG